MNIIYHTLRPLVKLGLSSYFRRIKVVGYQNIPEKGPAVIVANHPSAFLDPLMIFYIISYDLHFIAGAEWVGKGLKGWVFRNIFNMIPVIRPHLVAEGERPDNDKMFQYCYERLLKNGIIVIFPEGNSITEYRLRNIKTGVARIVEGTEALMKNGNSVKVIPIGLNYESPHIFQRDIILTIGEAVDFTEAKKMEGPDKIRRMTSDIWEGLHHQLWHIPDPELDTLIVKIKEILSFTLPEQHSFTSEDHDLVFRMNQDIIDGVVYFSKENPALVASVQIQIDDYYTKLKELGISDRDLQQPEKEYTLIKKWIIALTAPLAFPFIIINSIPYHLTRFLYRNLILPKIKINDEVGALNPSFSGSMIFALGFGSFLIYFSLLALGTGGLLGSGWWFLPVLVVLYSGGILSIRWLRAYNHIRYVGRLDKKAKANATLFEQCETLRSELITKLTHYKNEFLNTKNSNG